MRTAIGIGLSALVFLAACQQQVASTGGPSASGGTSAASTAAITSDHFLRFASWRQHDRRDPDLPLTGTEGQALTLRGSDHTNGQLVSGHYDGNGFSTRQRFDFVGKVVKTTVLIESGSQYMAMQIGPETGPAPELTTRQSFNGSLVVPGGERMTIVQRVGSDGTWSQDYVLADATSVGRREGRLDPATLAKLRSAPFMIVFGDNYGGRSQSIHLLEVHGLGAPDEPESSYWRMIEAAARGNDAEALARSGRAEEAVDLLIATESALEGFAHTQNPLYPIYVAAAEGLIPIPEAGIARVLLARIQKAEAYGLRQNAYSIWLQFGMFAAKAGQPAVLDQLAAKLDTYPERNQKDIALVRGLADILRGDSAGGYARMRSAGGISGLSKYYLKDFISAAQPFYADRAQAAALMGADMPTNVPNWRLGAPSQPFVDVEGRPVAALNPSVAAPATAAPIAPPPPPPAAVAPIAAPPPAPAGPTSSPVEILD